MAVLCALTLLSCSPSSGGAKPGEPEFRADLKQFGYLSQDRVAEYSSIGFLSDELLLVTINQRPSDGSGTNVLVLLDLAAQKVTHSQSIPLVKSPQAVAP